MPHTIHLMGPYIIYYSELATHIRKITSSLRKFIVKGDISQDPARPRSSDTKILEWFSMQNSNCNRYVAVVVCFSPSPLALSERKPYEYGECESPKLSQTNQRLYSMPRTSRWSYLCVVIDQHHSAGTADCAGWWKWETRVWKKWKWLTVKLKRSDKL